LCPQEKVKLGLVPNNNNNYREWARERRREGGSGKYITLNYKLPVEPENPLCPMRILHPPAPR